VHWGQKRCTQGFGRKTEGKKPLGRLRVKWEDILKWILKKLKKMAQDRDNSRTLVNFVMALSVHKPVEYFFIS
jgi:hypothetical protein